MDEALGQETAPQGTKVEVALVVAEALDEAIERRSWFDVEQVAESSGDAHIAANPGGSQVMIRLTPEHWLSRAYSDG